MSRIMGVDPGAFRMGWAVLDDGEYMGSGIFGLERGSNGSKAEEYQKYRLRLIDFWTKEGTRLLNSYKPDSLVSEIVPAVGGGNFVVAAQSQLAATAITTLQAVSCLRDIPISQVSANTVKRNIGGVKDASKAKVRDGVITLLPNLADRKKQWVKVFDESDALAITLTKIGKRI